MAVTFPDHAPDDTGAIGAPLRAEVDALWADADGQEALITLALREAYYATGRGSTAHSTLAGVVRSLPSQSAAAAYAGVPAKLISS